MNKSIINLQFYRKNKQLLYTIFFIIFAFAKVWGYTAADQEYLLLAALGVLFCFASFIGSKYSLKEIIVVCSIMLVSCLSLFFSHKLGAILPGLVLVSAKDIDINKVIKNTLFFWIPIMVIRVVCTLLGLFPMVTEVKNSYISGEVTVYGMGYCTGNCFYTVVIVGILLFIYTYFNQIKLWWICLIELIAIILFFPSKSLTGTLVLSLCCFSIIVYKIVNKLFHNKQKISNITCMLLCLGTFFPVVLTFALIPLYNVNKNMTRFVNIITTNRVSFNYSMFKAYSVSLFGQRFTGKIGDYEMLDNAYAYTLIGLGACMFVLYAILYFICIINSYKKRNIQQLFILFIFFVYGFMEQFLINPFMNFTVLLLCEIIWSTTNTNISENMN